MNSQAYLEWCGVDMEYWVLCWVFYSQEFKKVKMVNNMKRNICLILAFTLLFLFSSCQKEVEKDVFISFSKECLAESYYDICGNFLDENKCKYFYNEDEYFVFIAYTMALVYSCESGEFKQVKSQIAESFDTYTLVEETQIDDNSYEILYVKDDNRQYGGFKEFGFIAMNKNQNEIRFYWFYDQDYDLTLINKERFDEFYKMYYDWL